MQILSISWPNVLFLSQKKDSHLNKQFNIRGLKVFRSKINLKHSSNNEF